MEYEVDYHYEPKNFAGDCVYFTQRHFIDQFIQDQPFETNGQDYLRNLQLQEAIYNSSAERREIIIK